MCMTCIALTSVSTVTRGSSVLLNFGTTQAPNTLLFVCMSARTASHAFKKNHYLKVHMDFHCNGPQPAGSTRVPGPRSFSSIDDRIAYRSAQAGKYFGMTPFDAALMQFRTKHSRSWPSKSRRHGQGIDYPRPRASPPNASSNRGVRGLPRPLKLYINL